MRDFAIEKFFVEVTNLHSIEMTESYYKDLIDYISIKENQFYEANQIISNELILIILNKKIKFISLLEINLINYL